MKKLFLTAIFLCLPTLTHAQTFTETASITLLPVYAVGITQQVPPKALSQTKIGFYKYDTNYTLLGVPNMAVNLDISNNNKNITNTVVTLDNKGEGNFTTGQKSTLSNNNVVVIASY